MIETIPKQNVEQTSIDSLLATDDMTKQCVQWLDLHQHEIVSTNFDIIDVTNTNSSEGHEVDTNNNNKSSSYVEIRTCDKIFPPGHCECKKDEQYLNNKIHKDNQVTQTDFSTPNSNCDNSATTNQTSLVRENKTTEIFLNVEAHYQTSSPLLIRPILKKSSEKRSNKEINISNQETANESQSNFECTKSSSVSFLLPSENKYISKDVVDSKMASKEEQNFEKNDLTCPPESGVRVEKGQCVQNLQISSNETNQLRMSRPSSFSDSDISDDENAQDKILPIKKIDEMMKAPLNVEEGGRYSILNKDFSSKVKEKSVYSQEVETLRKEIIYHHEKCEVSLKKSFKTSSFTVPKKTENVIIDHSGYSSGESTDTLLEEARNYVQMAKEKIVTVEDWKVIEEKKKKYRKR